MKTEELKSLEEDLGGMFEIPRNFERTAPTHNPDGSPPMLQIHTHPWTKLLCEVLGITDPMCVFTGLTDYGLTPERSPDQDESVLSDDDVPDTSQSFISSDTSFNLSTASFKSLNSNRNLNRTHNPDEISLDLDSDSESDHESEDQPNSSQLSQISEIVSLNTSYEESQQSQSSSSPASAPVSQSETEGTQSSQSESEVSKDSKDSAGPPTAKKFKRRNQSIYSSSD